MAGKKRKATSAPAAKEHVPDDSSKRTRMRIKTYEDVAGSDDEFHLNRDKVMLDDGPEAKRRRKVQEEEAFLEQSDEEVLGYSSPSEAEDEDDDLHADEPGKAPSKNSKGADDEDEDEQEEDEDEVGGWGTTKQDYYDADVIETEQDALDEEKEALRLQKKQLQGMSAADYGFDESEWQQEEGDEAGEKEEGDVVTEVLPQLELDENLSAGERLKLLKSRYPEFEPLSKELLTLNETYTDLCQQKSPSTATKTKQQAAAAYLASLTMYFALLTSTAEHSQTNGLALSATAIRDHPVMDSLIQCRDLWTTLKDLPDEEPEDETALDLSEEDAMSEDEPVVLDIKPKAHKEKKTKAQRTLEYAEKEAAARRAERLARTEADFDDLNALTTGLASRKTKKPTAAAMAAAAAAAAENSDSDFGEDTTLTSQELAEKAKRKKSLRFYTSQIAQKANRRGAAGRNAGGDDDLPYRERLRDRQTRLNAEATARGRNQPGDDLGASDEDEDDRRAAKDVRGDQEDEYYDFIAAKNTLKKTEKAALAAAQKEAEASGGRVVPQETVGKDGKRAITYAIEKNKGLTPHRKKDVRNPRVKKRKKFEEKKKKLASIKPVYKGGEGRGGYGGELTGIKKGLVRSTKLS